jgi:hypothetical protein
MRSDHIGERLLEDAAASRNAPLGDAMVVVVVLLVVVVGAAVVVVGAAVVVVGAAVVVVGAAVVVVGAAVVVVGATVVVVLPQTNEPSGEPAPQESQQLAAWPAHAWPPFGALHLLALDLIEHFTFPRRSMRQQVTAPDLLPHVDLAAQLVTTPLHSFGRSSPFNACVTQLTYCPWLVASVQGHSVSMAKRAAATAASSVHFFADAMPVLASTRATANTLRATNFMGVLLLCCIGIRPSTTRLEAAGLLSREAQNSGH